MRVGVRSPIRTNLVRVAVRHYNTGSAKLAENQPPGRQEPRGTCGTLFPERWCEISAAQDWTGITSWILLLQQSEGSQKLLGTHLCNLCVDTRWLAHVLRDRPDGSHGAGGLLQVGGPVADALWLQGFGVALLTLCLFVGGKQKISTRKKNEHSMPSSSSVHRTETHTVLRVQPHPFANLAQVPLFPAPSATHPGSALGRLGVRVTNQPTWCWARCSSAVRGLPRGQVCLAPWEAQGPVSVTVVSRVCAVTMAALVACTPLALVAIQPVTSVGWRRPNVVALGHLVRLSRCAR